MTTQPSLFDICSRKHGGHVNSVAANKRVEPYKSGWRGKVYEYVLNHQECTLAQICQHFGKEKNCLSGRISELKQLGKLVVVGTDSKGCDIYAAI